MSIIIIREVGCSAEDSWFSALVAASLDECGYSLSDYQIGITLTDDAGVRKLNQEYRNIDSATDVLSFPLIEYAEDYEESEAWDDREEEEGKDVLVTDPDTGEMLMGDIVISVETATRQAKKYGHSLNREMGYLTVHGMMHLLGYDHIKDEDRRIMREAEERVLSRFKLTRGEGSKPILSSQEMMKEEKPFHSGFVTLIGRSNVGKSTLMNRIVEEKVSIISDKPQTTRSIIRGVLNGEDFQMIFIDTPGMHIPRTRLGEYMVRAAKVAMEAADILLMVMDASLPLGGGDRALLKELASKHEIKLLALNKIDLIAPERLLGLIAEVRELCAFEEIVPISAKSGDGVPNLVQLLRERLQEGPRYFPEDMYTDQPERAIMAEMIREKALLLLREEVPYGIGVEIVRIAPHSKNRRMQDVYADIYVERENHKSILIGKKGVTLREIGVQARKDIEEMLGYSVNLQLYVRVKEKWRNRPANLRDLGYTDKE